MHAVDSNAEHFHRITRQFYDSDARDYFRRTVVLELPSLWEKFSRLPASSLILDIGCGSGRDLRHFFAQGYRVVGLDYSLSLLKLAKEYSRQPVVCANLLAIPFREGSFDGAWALGSLLHVSRSSVSCALNEISRVLRPEALLFTAMKKGTGESVDQLGRYNVYYESDEWANMLLRNGFTVLMNEITHYNRNQPSAELPATDWIINLARFD